MTSGALTESSDEDEAFWRMLGYDRKQITGRTLSEYPEGRGSPYYDREGRQIDLFKWADLLEDPDYARVCYSELPDGTCISTVWFGVSAYPEKPLIFETIVFSPAGEVVECWRYQTRDEAHAGHDQIVASMTQSVEEREAKLTDGERGTY